jgi:hypothetical protein
VRELDTVRAWRVVGLFAPVSIVASVALAAIAIIDWTWSPWAVGALAAVGVASVGWLTFRGESTGIRIAVTVATVTISGLATCLVLLGLWPWLGSFNDGLIPAWTLYSFVGVPWLVLVGFGTFALRAGSYEGAPHGSLYWILAIVAAGFAYPLVAWVTEVARADDMSALVLFFIPALAMCLWAGPAAVMLVKGGFGRAVAAPVAPLREVAAE